MADEDKSAVVPIVAGAVLVVLVIAGFLFFRNSTAQLRPDVSKEQFEEIKREEKKEERSLLSDLEKKYGPDHPQVKQMKMELGDAPFPDTPKD
jgi:hypothetical protein